ncbi:MAG: J domain-containing protein [Bacteroidia bacterium]
MNYFKDCTTIEEVKKLYRTLAKENHPDKGGDTATMQRINTEYTFACAKIAKGQNLSDEETENIIINAERYREALDKIINLPGLIIELVGAWLWVTGNTYEHRATLKAAGFIFAHKKVAWYFRTDEYKTHNRHSMSLQEIKNKYGVQSIQSNNQQRFIAA